MDRRGFLTVVGALSAASIYALRGNEPASNSVQAAGSPYELPKLPYSENALAPIISSNTVSFHYGKHHVGYVSKYNEAVAGTAYAEMTLTDTLRSLAAIKQDVTLFNLAAQIWNHNFYWQSLHPKAGGPPKGRMKELVEANFGSYDNFRTVLATKATNFFGSGWIWLVLEGGKLAIEQTQNAETPLTSDKTPLLTIDVWEHAYYLDYQNRRKDYVEAVIDRLLNWDFANANVRTDRTNLSLTPGQANLAS